MAVSLKPLHEQVIVITGASSGIGLATARMAAKKGAKLVLAARSADALQQIEQELTSSGAQVATVVADVGRMEDVQRIADTAISRFGGFDTWFNNAGIGIYGKVEEVTLDDARRLFDTNFWGEVHGSLVATRHLKQRGGALINMGSIESDRAVPLHAHYAASKHAVQGFTDALRMELEKDGAPVSVTLIKPAAIDTPFIDHAKNYMPNEPNLPPPVYAPEVVARAVLHAATHRERSLVIGGSGSMITGSGKASPRIADLLMRALMFRQQQKDEPARPDHKDALYTGGDGAQERGSYRGHVAKTSAATEASMHPLVTTLLIGAVGVGVAAALGAKPPVRSKDLRRLFRAVMS